MGTEESYTYTTCMGSACHEFCILKTFYKDGKVIRTEKADIDGPESNRFECCQKGIDYARFVDNPSRLHYPMKRVGERGEGKFERISWDEAIDQITGKMAELRDTYGPHSLLFTINPSGYPGANFSLFTSIQMRFLHLIDASASMLNSVDQSFFGAQSIDMGSMFMYNMSDPRLLEKTKYLLIWASNPIGNTRAAVTTRAILDAQDAGAKLAHVGVMYNSTAAKSDMFVPIKPGTDYALALSMAREIIKRNAVDFEFLAKKTVAPFLVRNDSGKFLRASDISADESSEDYIVWQDNAPVVVPAHAHPQLTPQMTGEVEASGIACKPAFQLLVEHLEVWTLQHQEEITGVSAELASQLVDDYLAVKPACIYLEEGLRYQNSVQSYRAIQLLSYLTGNYGIPGGGLTIIGMGQGHPAGTNEYPVMFPEGLQNAKGNYVFPQEIYDHLEDGELPYKAYFNFFGNPVHSNPGRQNWEKFFKNMELVVVHDIFMSDTALYADYLLPDTTTFERQEILTQGNHIVLQEAIPPKFEEKSGSEVYSLLARNLGYGEFFDKTDEEWNIFRLASPAPAFANVDPPITMERLKAEKQIRLAVPEDLYDPMDTDDFVTPSGRLEFYCEEFASLGMAMASAAPTLMDQLSDQQKSDYPLQLFTGRPRLFMQTQPFNVMDDLLELHGHEPWMWLNPVDAAERSIEDGDMVEIYNDRGNAKLRVKLSQTVPPGIAHPFLNYMARQYTEGGPTYMMTMTGTSEIQDQFGHVWQNYMNNRWNKPVGNGSINASPIMNVDAVIAGNYDVIWDNYCNVRRA